MGFFQVSLFGFDNDQEKYEDEKDYKGQTDVIVEVGIFLIERYVIDVCGIVEFHGRNEAGLANGQS